MTDGRRATQYLLRSLSDGEGNAAAAADDDVSFSKQLSLAKLCHTT